MLQHKLTRKLYPAGPTPIPTAGPWESDWTPWKAERAVRVAEAARREAQYRRWLAARSPSLELAGAAVEILELEAGALAP